ncbi:hypothetical protein [Streptomyces pratensis]|uniref:hypothetical protein n=1 Tax=Streptomyces pratensis TaxID=1169025 RepID=UPI00301B4982
MSTRLQGRGGRGGRVDARETVEPDDLDELGGLLTFPAEKELYYRVETEVLLGQGAAGTATGAAAEQAVAAFSDRDAPYWAFGDEAGARCNLAGSVSMTRSSTGPSVPCGRSWTCRPRSAVAGSSSPPSEFTAPSRSPVRSSLLARELREEITQYSPAALPPVALRR